jgi:hypothetical protein
MARINDVHDGIWSDPDFEDLTPNAKLVYLWSFTNPLCGPAGIYRVKAERVALDTGLSAEALQAAVAELEACTMLYFRDRVLWVRSRVRYLRTRTPQMAKGVAADLRRIPDDCPLQQAFRERYSQEAWLAPFLGGEDPPPDASPAPPATSAAAAPAKPRAAPSKRVSQDAFPDNFPAQLQGQAQRTLSVLTSVQAERGGYVPTLRGVALAIAALPDRDHEAVARELVHWATAGRGQNKPVKDWAATLSTFMQRAPAAAASRPGVPGQAPESDEVKLLREMRLEAAAAREQAQAESDTHEAPESVTVAEVMP